MATCSPCVYFVNVYKFVFVLLSLLVLSVGPVWDLIVLVPDHFLFIQLLIYLFIIFHWCF